MVYAEKLVGIDMEDLMASSGKTFYELFSDQQFRWLGPPKGLLHLALTSDLVELQFRYLTMSAFLN